MSSRLPFRSCRLSVLSARKCNLGGKLQRVRVTLYNTPWRSSARRHNSALRETGTARHHTAEKKRWWSLVFGRTSIRDWEHTVAPWDVSFGCLTVEVVSRKRTPNMWLSLYLTLDCFSQNNLTAQQSLSTARCHLARLITSQHTLLLFGSFGEKGFRF